MSKGHSPTSFMPTMPVMPSAESLLKAQPRAIVLLGLIPTAAATAYWFFTGNPQGMVAAGLLLAAGACFLAVQAGLRKMTAVHWVLLLALGFVAVQINAGEIGAKALLSFASLLVMVVVAMRLPGKERVMAGAVAFFAWLATAGAPGMATTHDTAEAGIAEASALAFEALRHWLTSVWPS